MSDEAYLGAYEDSSQIKLVITKEFLSDFLSYMEEDGEITMSDKQFADFLKRSHDLGLVSAFIEEVVTLAEQVIEGK
jgi:hypothetical protein